MLLLQLFIWLFDGNIGMHFVPTRNFDWMSNPTFLYVCVQKSHENFYCYWTLRRPWQKKEIWQSSQTTFLSDARYGRVVIRYTSLLARHCNDDKKNAKCNVFILTKNFIINIIMFGIDGRTEMFIVETVRLNIFWRDDRSYECDGNCCMLLFGERSCQHSWRHTYLQVYWRWAFQLECLITCWFIRHEPTIGLKSMRTGIPTCSQCDYFSRIFFRPAQ